MYYRLNPTRHVIPQPIVSVVLVWNNESNMMLNQSIIPDDAIYYLNLTKELFVIIYVVIFYGQENRCQESLFYNVYGFI